MWLDTDAPRPVAVLYNGARDVYIVLYENDADGVSSLEILRASLASLWKGSPHEGPATTAVSMLGEAIFVTSGASDAQGHRGDISVWRLLSDDDEPVDWIATLDEHAAVPKSSTNLASHGLNN